MGEVGQGNEMKGPAGFLLKFMGVMLAIRTTVNVGYKNNCVQLLRTFFNIRVGSHRDDYLVPSVVF